MKKITKNNIKKFEEYLKNEEKSTVTVEKYIHDVTVLFHWLNGRELTKSAVIEYKSELLQVYKPTSVNCILSSLNAYFMFANRQDCRVKMLKIQRQIFAPKEKELSKSEYERLLKAAKSKNNQRLYLLMQTICSTGIRVSELKFITASAIRSGVTTINCKGKLRQVFLPKTLCKTLLQYVKEQKITSGSVFVTKTGKPLDRSNIWSEMKKLCIEAGVSKDKVFPHNLRHLFARTYYTLRKDISRLADILGHSSVNTTRIYTMETGDIHRRQMEGLGLVCIT